MALDLTRPASFDRRRRLRCDPIGPPADQVGRTTFVPFLPDGRCVLVAGTRRARAAVPARDRLRGPPGGRAGRW